MELTELLTRHCVEYPAGRPPLSPEEVQKRMALVPGWELVDDGKGLRFSERMADFQTVIDFVTRVAELAEAEQHHPDIWIHGYRNLQMDFSTHSIGGLSENDFIMAAKVNALRQ